MSAPRIASCCSTRSCAATETAGHHLHRRRRALRQAAAAGGAAGRAARRPGPPTTGRATGARAHRRRPSAAAVRHPQRRPRARCVPGAPFTFDPTAPHRRRGRRRRTRTIRRDAVHRAADTAGRRRRHWPTCWRSSRTRSKGFFRALDYTLPWDVEGVEDAMPVEIDAPAGLGGRRPDAHRHAAAACTPTTPRTPSGAAARCRRAGWAARRPARSAIRPAPLAEAAIPHRDRRPGRLRHRPRPGRWPPPDRHRPRRLRQPDRLGHLLQAGAPNMCCRPGFRCWRWPLQHPGRDWSALCIGRGDAHVRSASGCSARPPTRRRCCASWWRSTTRAGGNRCRCR